MGRKCFRVILIKPSRYDDDGYVIQWLRSSIPSNSLAVLYGLIREAADSGVLGHDVDVTIDAYDETNAILPLDAIKAELAAADGGFVGMVGVQSNQYPRAMDLAREFRAADIPVVIGGFHVSGCLAMLPGVQPDLQEAMDQGVILFAGEAEGRIGGLMRDIYFGHAKPLYNYLNDLPDMRGAASPFLPAAVVRRTIGWYSSFDSGRGCPFQCSFCTIINVQGRISRRRTADDVEMIVRKNAAQGIERFIISDDNFARNKDWESILDRLIYLREEEGFNLMLILQVDTLCHKIPRFIDKSARAGCYRVFLGLENINPANLMHVKKRQNKITEYQKMLQAWKDHGIMTYAGYIVGFPADSPESVAEDIATMQRELPLDLAEFFILTPLPGSEDHKTLFDRGVPMDPDMNNYDVTHVTTAHAKMSADELARTYRDAWRQYYTNEHIARILRRAEIHKVPEIFDQIIWFAGGMTIEGVHPLELGYFRRKVRTQRRHGLPHEARLPFYSRRVWDTLATHGRWFSLAARVGWLRWRVRREIAWPAKKKSTVNIAPQLVRS